MKPDLAAIRKRAETNLNMVQRPADIISLLDYIEKLGADKQQAYNLLRDTFIVVNRNSYSGYITGECKCCGSKWEGFDLTNGEWHETDCKFLELLKEATTNGTN